MKILDLGLKKYAEVLHMQEELFNNNVEAKLRGVATQNTIILCEHEPVFTLGKSGHRENILVSKEEMKAEFYHTNRGGDVTFHGPGQLVVYPILDLDKLEIGLAKYIAKLEETIIETLKAYNIIGQRLDGAAGIWIKDKGPERKICAIGVKASRNITMHGLAININTDLSYFGKIIPCGLENKQVTSIQKELNQVVDLEKYKKAFITTFVREFGL
ncbi:MAG: lipoyl(octanoyl) transferase LipB [Bacteroidetes bacterium]|nr:lipoyl(octanoyl) transferase LipB [Bacteroidota bacterium]